MRNFIIWLTGTTLKDRLTNLAALMAFSGTVTGIAAKTDLSKPEQIAVALGGVSIALTALATGKSSDMSHSERK